MSSGPFTIQEIRELIEAEFDEVTLALRRAEAVAYLAARLNFVASKSAPGVGEVDIAFSYFDLAIETLNEALAECFRSSPIQATDGFALAILGGQGDVRRGGGSHRAERP